MRNETRERFDAYVETVAKLNGVSNATKKFAVSPSVQQKLETRIQESSDFLKRVNMIGVTEQQGEKLGLGIGSPIAGTTDTTKQDRETTDVSDLDAHGYICTQT